MTPIAYILHDAKRFAPGLLDLLHHIGRRKVRPAVADPAWLQPFEQKTSTPNDDNIRRAA